VRARLAVLASMGLVLVVSGCATLDPLEDTRIESEVKAKLVAEKAANLTRIGVLSSNGNVYLTGTVVSADQKARAEAVTKGVNGVRRVVNSLEVAPPPR
jgi:hyperosmotically inducible periplasmic protein